MLPPNILQARSKTRRQATRHSTSAMLKCTLMPKNQHVTNCQIIVSSSPFPLSLKTQLISYKGKRHYTRPSPTSGTTSLLQEVSPRQRRSPGEVNRYSCLSHSKIHRDYFTTFATPSKPNVNSPRNLNPPKGGCSCAYAKHLASLAALQASQELPVPAHETATRVRRTRPVSLGSGQTIACPPVSGEFPCKHRSSNRLHKEHVCTQVCLLLNKHLFQVPKY